MAGSIRTNPATKELRAHWDKAMGEGASVGAAAPRVEAPHECEHCGKVMRYADQQCACVTKRPLS